MRTNFDSAASGLYRPMGSGERSITVRAGGARCCCPEMASFLASVLRRILRGDTGGRGGGSKVVMESMDRASPEVCDWTTDELSYVISLGVRQRMRLGEGIVVRSVQEARRTLGEGIVVDERVLLVCEVGRLQRQIRNCDSIERREYLVHTWRAVLAGEAEEGVNAWGKMEVIRSLSEPWRSGRGI